MGNNLSITATGAGPNSDITAQGSTLQAEIVLLLMRRMKSNCLLPKTQQINTALTKAKAAALASASAPMAFCLRPAPVAHAATPMAAMSRGPTRT